MQKQDLCKNQNSLFVPFSFHLLKFMCILLDLYDNWSVPQIVLKAILVIYIFIEYYPFDEIYC